MSRRKSDLTAPYQSIRGAAQLTGLAAGYIRAGCKAGTIPHIRAGQDYRICMPLFLAQLEAESAGNVRCDHAGQ